MSKFKSILVAGAALVAMSGVSLATDGTRTYKNLVPLLNQYNPAVVFSDTKIYADWVGGNLRGTSTAVGNNLSLETKGSTYIFLVNQLQMADVGASLKVFTGSVGGDVDLSATGICNNASISNSNSDQFTGSVLQRCQTIDPYATINASFGTVGGGVGANATAVANNLTMDLEAKGIEIYPAQANASAVYANVNVSLGNVGGNVDISATAIGNNMNIKHVLGN